MFEFTFDNLWPLAIISQFIYVCTWLSTVVWPSKDPKRDEVKMHMAKCQYYFTIGLTELSALHGYKFLPGFLGGEGAYSNHELSDGGSFVWDGFINDERRSAFQKIYYIQTFYHGLASIVSVLPGNRTKPEMFLHHAVTMWLIISSWQIDHQLHGCLVLLVHDLPDVWVCLVKIFHVLGMKKSTLVVYTGLLISWAYFRLFLLGAFAYGVTMRPGSPENTHIWCARAIFTLVGLHLWWLALFIRMGMRVKTTGNLPKDLTQRDQQQVTQYLDGKVSTCPTRATANQLDQEIVETKKTV